MVTAAGMKSFFHMDKIGSAIAMSDLSGSVAEGPCRYDGYRKRISRLAMSGQITQFVTQQALSQAFQDVFYLLAALFVIALAIVPFAKVPKLTNEAPVEVH